MTGQADPQWLTRVIAGAQYATNWVESERVARAIRAALPAIRAGLADEIADHRERLIAETDSRMVWPTRLGEMMDGLTYAEKIVRGQS